MAMPEMNMPEMIRQYRESLRAAEALQAKLHAELYAQQYGRRDSDILRRYQMVSQEVLELYAALRMMEDRNEVVENAAETPDAL